MVDLPPVGLAVRPAGAADIGTFIVINPQPMQPVDQFLFRSGYIALLVGIFDPQDEGAAGAFRQQVRIQRRAGVPRCIRPVGEGAKRVRTGF